MPNYKSIWNKVVSQTDLPDVITSVSEASINDLLVAHRKYDSELYRRVEELKDETTGKVFFSLDLIVGGDRKAHNQGKALPLKMLLPMNYTKLAKQASAYEMVYSYRFHQGKPPEPNALLDAPNVNFYFAWPSSTGGTPWMHHVPGVNFRLEAHLRLMDEEVEEGKPRSLEIVPVRLRISKASSVRLKKSIKHALQKTTPTVTSDKVTDLFLALIGYGASTIGPGLAEAIELPAIKLERWELYPNLFAIQDRTVTLGASLDATKSSKQLRDKTGSFLENYWAAVDADIQSAGGIEPLVLTKSSLNKVRASAKTTGALATKLAFQSDQAILRNFKTANAYLNEAKAQNARLLSSRLGPATRAVTSKAKGTVPDGMAAAVNEYLLDKIVAQYGNILKEGYTNEIKILDLIRGRVGYRLSVGVPDIDITPAKGLTGSVPVDAWAGLLYRVRQINRCKIVWSGEKRIGLGIRGTPKVSIKTKVSRGLSLHADFDLSKLKLYTGAGFPIDDIVGALSPIFVGGIEGVLDLLALFLSFVVVPADLAAGEKTKLSLSAFKTSQYRRTGGPSDSRNNYLMLTAATEGKKA